MLGAVGELRTQRQIENIGIVAQRKTRFVPTPVSAKIAGSAQPAIEVVCKAGAKASRLTHQLRTKNGAGTKPESTAGSVGIGIRINPGIAPEQFPFGGRLF